MNKTTSFTLRIFTGISLYLCLITSGTASYYTIQPGDTLSHIAKQHAISLGGLIRHNTQYLTNPDFILARDKIKIPTQQPQKYTSIFTTNATTPCFDIYLLIINNNFLLTPTQITQLQLEHTYKCLTKKQIDQIIEHISSQYITAGYTTTRVGIIDINHLTIGKLIIEIIPGKISEIRINQSDMPRINRHLATAFSHINPHDILRLADIEKGLENLGRLSSTQASMNIIPDHHKATSWIDIQLRQQKPNNINFSINNAGIEPNKNSYSINYSRDNALAYNETITLGINNGEVFSPTDAGDKTYTRSYNLNFNIPYGNSLLDYQYHSSKYLGKNNPQTAQETTYSGKSNKHSLAINHTLYKHSHHSLEINNQLNYYQTEKYNNNILTTISSYTLAYLTSKISYNYNSHNISLNNNLGVEQGLDILGATKDKQTAQENIYSQPISQYTLLKLDTAFAWQWKNIGISQNIKFNSQYSQDNLWANYKFYPQVRGFQYNSLNANSGYGITLNYQFTPVIWFPKLALLSHLNFGIFYDYGKTSKNNDNPAEYITASGFNFNFNISFLSLSCTHAKPLQHARFFAAEEQPHNYCNLSASYSY